MLIGLLLALATPSPQPALPVLKTITRVRATPFCSALRMHIGPAIDNLLAADASIAQSPAMIETFSRDGVIFRDYPRTVLDMAHLETLITPLVKSTKNAQRELDAASDPASAQLRSSLQAVLQRQKDSLNLINGLITTVQMGDIMHQGSENNAAVALLDASPASFGVSRLPAFDPNNAGLGYDPYKPIVEQIQLQQKDIAAKENTASQIVLDAVRTCSGSGP
jgi:hypothetical protein